MLQTRFAAENRTQELYNLCKTTTVAPIFTFRDLYAEQNK